MKTIISFFAFASCGVLLIALSRSIKGEDRTGSGGSVPLPLRVQASASTNIVRTPRALSAQPQIAASYGNLPLSFEANRGQADPRVRFLSRGRGHGLFLTSREAILTMDRSTEKTVTGAGLGRTQVTGRVAPIFRTEHDSEPSKSTSLRMSLAGANPEAIVAGLDELPGKANYFLGNDQKKWRTNVPTYARVKYENIYSGVDLIYYGNQQDLESDFVVAPGAAPGVIRLKFRGTNRIEINRNGDLVLKIHGGETILHKPVAYQSNGKDVSPASDADKHFVAARYVLRGQREVQFGLEDYDRSRTLVIDPVLSYSTFLGGSGIDGGEGIAVDASGNAYVTGFTQSTDFPTVNPFQANSGGGLDAFVTKLDPTGTTLLYSTYLGGSGDDIGLGIAVDGAGSAYITGYTPSSNFPTLNAFQKTCSACIVTAFVTKLDPSGSKLEYSTYLGGGIGDIGTAIVVDAAGSAYVTGRTFSSNFPTTPGAYDTTCGTYGNCNNGFFDGFITKLSTDGKTLVYSTFLGGSSDEYPFSIAVDFSGNAYVTGSTYSTDFPITPGSFQQTCSCDSGEGFVTKLNPTGSALVYSTFLGGTKGTMGANLASVAVDGSGSAYVTGQTGATDYPTTAGAVQTTNNGGLEAVVTKLNSAGSALAYSTYLGGSQDDSGLTIAVDSTGAAYVLGETESPNFPTVTPLQAACASPVCRNFFVVKLAASGSSLIYSTFLGGSGEGNNIGLIGGGFNFASLALDNNRDAYLTSGTGAPDFPIIASAPYPDCVGCPGVGHAFIAKINDADAAAITIYPRSLTFDRQGLGVTSQPLTVAVGDRGSGPLTITNFATSGDFASTNTCGSGLADGNDCAVAVTFTPTATGTRTGELTFTDSATGRVNTITLSGTGVDGPVGRLSAASVSFVAQIGTTSTQTVTLTNLGNTALTISGIGTTGDFSETNTCPSTLASTASCAISVSFAPSNNGNQTGLLTVADNDVLSPQTAALTGFGSGARLNVTPGSLTFGEQGRGTSSTETVVLADLDKKFGQAISSISVTGSPDFAQTNNCPASLTALGYGGSSCTVSVTFKPSALETETATLTIVAGLTYTVPLSGTGVDFSISASASALSVAVGGTATSTLSVAPQGGFNQTTNLRCLVSPVVSQGPVCSVAPTSVTLDGSTTATATVTVTTTARSASSAVMTQRTLFPDSRSLVALFCLPALACVFIASPRRRYSSRRRAWAGITAMLLFAVLSFGCGGGSSSTNNGTPVGSYTLTVTGKSGSLTHTVNLTLKVN